MLFSSNLHILVTTTKIRLCRSHINSVSRKASQASKLRVFRKDCVTHITRGQPQSSHLTSVIFLGDVIIISRHSQPSHEHATFTLARKNLPSSLIIIYERKIKGKLFQRNFIVIVNCVSLRGAERLWNQAVYSRWYCVQYCLKIESNISELGTFLLRQNALLVFYNTNRKRNVAIFMVRTKFQKFLVSFHAFSFR